MKKEKKYLVTCFEIVWPREEKKITILLKKKEKKMDHPSWIPRSAIDYPTLEQIYLQQEGCFWTERTLKLEEDVKDIPKLHPKILYAIKLLLAFFASADNIVMDNIGNNFFSEVTHPQLRGFWALQNAIEYVHARVYLRLILTYVKDETERSALFNSVITHPTIAAKAKWCEKYMNRELPLYHRLVAFAAVEGIFFSSSFCLIYWLKKRNLLPGLTQSNEYIARDEGLHCLFACELFCLEGTPFPELSSIIKDAVELECEFVRDILKENLDDMNSTDMSTYVQFCADQLMRNLKQTPIFNVKNPFPWMDLISMQNKTNFFEHHPTEYAMAIAEEDEDEFNFNAQI